MTLGPSDITRGPLNEALLSALRWNAVFLVWEAGLSEDRGVPWRSAGERGHYEGLSHTQVGMSI